MRERLNPEPLSLVCSAGVLEGKTLVAIS
jgi:hypothetical protein